MKLELEFGFGFGFGSYLCCTATLEINGINAQFEDFGEKYDRDEENAEEYGCGDMQFTRIPSTIEILQKYNITQEEYIEIAQQLEEDLSFGYCRWCV